MSSRPLGVALATLDARGRAWAVAIAAVTATERAFLLVGALSFVNDEGRQRTMVLAGLVVALYLLRSYLRSELRVAVQRRLYRGVAEAVLSSDPLVAVAPGGVDPEVILADGVHYGALLVADRIPAVAGDAVAALGIAVFVLLTQPSRLLVVGGAGVALATVTAVAMRRLTTQAQDAAWEVYRPLMERMLFAMRGRLELIANGAETALLESLGELLVRFQRVTVRADRLAAGTARAPLLAGACGVGVAVLAQGHGSVPTTAVADIAVLACLLPAFVGLAQNAHESRRLLLLFRPMAGMLSLPVLKRGGTQAVPEPPSPIVLRDVSYRYRGATRDAVSGVSLTFSRGEPLVLSGPNGSGKSTILRLIAGLAYPASGSLAVDGVDVETIDPTQWRAKIAYLPQQPHMADGSTVAEAMDLLVPRAKHHEIRAALARVGILDVLAARGGDPLSVRVGELSIGQRKRVAIARLLLKDAPIVLLDEPDANLDEEGVAMVAAIAAELAATKLVAVAAHTDRFLSAPGVHVRLAA